MRLKRRLQRPRPIGPWLWTAGISGFVLPIAALQLFTLMGYYPIGRLFSPSTVLIYFGPMLLVVGAWFLSAVAAIVYSLLSWSWLPMGLAVLFMFFGFVGSMPAGLGADRLQRQSFAQFTHRSTVLIHAILRYTADEGRAPADLDALVPDYLPALPDAGMAAAPRGYRYEAGPGPCSSDNAWSLAVCVPDLLTVHRLLYCPRQDYGSMDMIGGWAHEEQDHY
jgi:hypothetical protein